VQKLIIEGSRELRGEIRIQGAKNSILPIMAATLLCDEECIIYNCPDILDVKTTIEILQYLGRSTTFEDSVLTVKPGNLKKSDIPEFLMRKMRSSIVFLGALISKTGKAEVTLPGGCELGPRPIDMHLSGFKQLGVRINENHGKIECSVIKRIKGAEIMLPFPSVGTTENIMLAAVSCEEVTTIRNAAREPEIVDLANFLNKMGASIDGAGESTITIKGCKKFNSASHKIIPDRIVAITYLCAAAITGSRLVIKGIPKNFINSVIPLFEETGCLIKFFDEKNLQIYSPERLQSVKTVRTMPYPGFPTDVQAPVMAMLTTAFGTSVFVETIFGSRYKHVDELARLGANIKTEGSVAIVDGVKNLSGANVSATDLRGAAALVIAALAAEGVTIISNIGYLKRGYEKMEDNLRSLGAVIKQSM
jgi:UDP-N-acetylglucosamine 1-carboxyvinyltransferase